MISCKGATVYPYRIFPTLIILIVALGACTNSDGELEPLERLVAVNAQLDAVSADPASFITVLEEIVAGFDGRVTDRTTVGDGVSVELRVPVDQWAEAFSELRRQPEVTDGDQVWAQDITDQVAELAAELETATGDEAELLRDGLAFRADRVTQAVIVVRIRPPGH